MQEARLSGPGPKCFLDATIEGNYPNKDYHRVYVGEIVSVLKRG